MQKIDDIVVMNLIKSGDKKAFKHLFDEYYVPLCRFVYLSVEDAFASEEIVQDIFVYVWEKRDEIEIRLTLKAYLFQAAKNRALNYCRDNSRMSFFYDLPDVIDCEDKTVELHELQNLIEEAVLALPEKCSEIFRMSREKNLSNSQIAKIKGLSVRTVENHIARALAKIKRHLGEGYSYFW